MPSSHEQLVAKANIAAKESNLEEIHHLVTEWKKFDLNGDEIIQVREVEKFLSSLKVNMPADKRAELIKALDTNGDGTVSFIEFVHLYNSPGFKQYKYYTNRA